MRIDKNKKQISDNKLLEILIKVLKKKKETILNEKNYINKNFLDSMQILILIAEIEKVFDINFNRNHMELKNFQSFENIKNLLKKYKN